jgi:hypothetical protein
VAVVAFTVPAMALIVIDFEQPTYVPAPLVGQDGWYLKAGAGTANVIQTDNGPTLPGEQCVEMSDLVDQIRVGKLVENVVATEGPLVTFQYDIRLLTNMQGEWGGVTTWRSRLYDTDVGIAAIGNMHYDGGGGPACQAWAWDDALGANNWAPGDPAWLDTGWHQVIWTLDYSTQNFVSVTFDGTVYPRDGWSFADWPPIADSIQELTMWLFGDGAAGVDVWHVDNYIIQGAPSPVIPEPGTMALMGVGLLSLLGLKRRKK